MVPAIANNSIKSTRSLVDSQASRGVACTDLGGRALAQLGKLSNGVEAEFSDGLDIKGGGILLALPFLIDCGHLDEIQEHFEPISGFYSLESVFLTLLYMALSRVKNPEQLRQQSPGELGKCLGIDRAPEAKTLRGRISRISKTNDFSNWLTFLSETWLNEIQNPPIFLVDGHVHIYYGEQTKLPKRFKSGRRLCMSSMMDYWVNDNKGNPFFVISTVLTDGLIGMMRTEIVPRLLNEFKGGPTEEELSNNQYLHRFVLIYDREGYSYQFMYEMLQLRIACQTYQKFVKEDWPKTEFKSKEITLVFGNVEEIKIAERDNYEKVKDAEGNTTMLRVREVRTLSESDHQTSIISTNYIASDVQIASEMFSRWCQENYLKYMTEHFDLDRLTDYSVQEINGTYKFVSQEYKDVEKRIKACRNKISGYQKKVGKLIEASSKANLPKKEDSPQIEIDEKHSPKVKEHMQEIEKKKEELQLLIEERSSKPKHIEYKDMPENLQHKQLNSPGKKLTDMIKMIAYRAETAMALAIKDWMPATKVKSESRTILRGFFKSDADFKVDKENHRLTVKVHSQATPAINQILANLCQLLNETPYQYPNSKYTIEYQIVG